MNNLLLGVNIDHVATLRQVRGTRYPDPVEALFAAEQGGADSITVHLREDRRHILERDVELIQQVMLTRLNLEMAITDGMVQFASRIKPYACCLVPEKREELTTEGGLDVIAQEPLVTACCQQLMSLGINVSLFIDPDPYQIEAAIRCGVPTVEIHTGAYADAAIPLVRDAELQRIKHAVQFAYDANLRVNAGHGLNYQNVSAIAALPHLYELNIGHSIIARAVLTGLKNAVREMKHLMSTAQSKGTLHL